MSLVWVFAIAVLTNSMLCTGEPLPVEKGSQCQSPLAQIEGGLVEILGGVLGLLTGDGCCQRRCGGDSNNGHCRDVSRLVGGDKNLTAALENFKGNRGQVTNLDFACDCGVCPPSLAAIHDCSHNGYDILCEDRTSTSSQACSHQCQNGAGAYQCKIHLPVQDLSLNFCLCCLAV